jgi:predicted Mrr-cat superfamily restriction endonuclease
VRRLEEKQMNTFVNIFQIKTKPHGTDRLNEFLKSHFICIGWPGIGNLDGVSKEEIRERLKKTRNEDNARTIGVDLGNIWAFVDTMKEDSIVFFHGHHRNVHIVKVGPYKYVKEFDNDKDGMCHQREFELLATVTYEDLNPKLQELMRHRGTVTKFKYPFEDAELDFLIGGQGTIQTDPFRGDENYIDTVPEEIINDALNVLYDALNSNDPDKRFRAAVEILRYVK